MEYVNIISLGGNCFVASNLKELGLRNKSYPFDWTTSFDFYSVIDLIKNNFEGFLDYNNLYQYSKYKSYYYNDKYKIGFIHDFNKYISLRLQIKKVQEKYQRRIDRFYNSIQQPTLFIRYVVDLKDLQYIGQNQTEIEEYIKSFNPNNNIIFCSHFEECDKIVKGCYYVDKDEQLWFTEQPLLKNASLKEYLTNLDYSNKKENFEFSRMQRISPKKVKSYGLLATVEYYTRKAINKQYKHNRIKTDK